MNQESENKEACMITHVFQKVVLLSLCSCYGCYGFVILLVVSSKVIVVVGPLNKFFRQSSQLLHTFSTTLLCWITVTIPYYLLFTLASCCVGILLFHSLKSLQLLLPVRCRV